MILTSPKAWKTKHFYLKLSDCFGIQQAPEQYCSWGAYQTFKQYHDLNYPSHCFKASQDLTKKYLRHISVMLFLSQFKCIGNFVCCNSIPGHHIATNFCTCHDSIAVMSCAKFCSDRFFLEFWRERNKIFSGFELMEKLSVKWVRGIETRLSMTPEDFSLSCTDRSIILCSHSILKEQYTFQVTMIDLPMRIYF